MTFTTYELRLKGLLYCGVKGHTKIRFAVRPTKQQIESSQGDFYRVTSARLYEVSTTINERLIEAA